MVTLHLYFCNQKLCCLLCRKLLILNWNTVISNLKFDFTSVSSHFWIPSFQEEQYHSFFFFSDSANPLQPIVIKNDKNESDDIGIIVKHKSSFFLVDKTSITNHPRFFLWVWFGFRTYNHRAFDRFFKNNPEYMSKFTL